MIVSHRRKFIFLAVPKTGTHAIRFALRPFLGEGDEEQVKLFVESALSHPEIARLGHGHVSARQIKSVLPEETWRAYFKFAIVRNPWDRFVSYCAFMHRRTGLFAADPKAAMRRVLANPEHRGRVVFQPQHQFICDDAGAVMIDHVGRYEDLQGAFDHVCDQLALPRQTLERLNASEHGDYRTCYDDDLKEQVGELYARDIDTFGYAF